MNQLVRNYNPSSSYNQQYYPQGNYSSPPVYQDQGQRQNFQGQQRQNYQGGWNQNRRWNDRGGYNGHGAYSNRGNYGYGRSRDANSENWRRNPVIGTVYLNIPLPSAKSIIYNSIIQGHPQSSLGATLGVCMSTTAYRNHSTVSCVWPIGASRLNLRPCPLSI